MWKWPKRPAGRKNCNVRELAVLLTEDNPSRQDRSVAKVLQFFGVPSRTLTAAEFSPANLVGDAPSDRPRVLCSAAVFLRLTQDLERNPDGMQAWGKRLHSAFVYAGDHPEALQELARRLTGADDAVLCGMHPGAGDFVVSDHLNDFCGVMAGLRIAVCGANIASSIVLTTPGLNAINVISAGSGAPLLKVDYQHVPVFLSTFREIIDIDAELTSQNFDVRDHFLSALPLVLYVKWAFAETCWSAPEMNACLMIDDPALKARHGFVNFQELLSLMKRHKFSTNIAFIPWNWRRSTPKVVRLLRENPRNYSVSVHGCDHTWAEFGSSSQQRLYWKAQQALERMNRHESITGIRYDPVMVFPHGIFSEAAMRALKRTDLIAAVNNDVICADPHPRAITISDVWDIAVMRYNNFPIFTRRYPWEGIENFAFDALLGKPAIAVIHHDYCSDHCARLVNFIQRLNALQCAPTWRGLGDVVRRSCRQREVSPGEVEVEMYGTELRIENRSEEAKRFAINKRELDPSLVQEVGVASRRLRWRFLDDRVRFEMELKQRESTEVRIRFHELWADAKSDDTVGYRLRVMLRRYASELRDNYVTTNKLILRTRMRDVLTRDSESRAQQPLVSGKGNGSQAASQDSNSQMRVGCASQTTADSLTDQVSSALIGFTHWLSEYGETSWDYQSFFAGPIGGRAKSLYYRINSIGTAAVAPMIFCEAFLPSARRLFHHPIRFPIADAHYAMGFATLYEATGNPAHFQRVTHFLDELKASRCPNFEDYCWGYPFDWVTLNGTIPGETPLITTTPYVYEAFLQAHEIEPRQEWKRILQSIARHACNDIRDFKTSETASCCSYTPFDQSGGVVNAAAYRAFLLTSASRVFSNQHYWKTAERNLNFVLGAQNPDGSWPYAVDQVRDFVDHYHTCFVMKSLAKIYQLTGDKASAAALEKGIQYYSKNLFSEDGLPKPFSKAPRLTVYKHELYDCAECINLCLLLRDKFPQLEMTLETVIEGILRHWIKSDGSFRSRRLHLGWDNVPMHRWGQSQMFRSLAFYLREASRAETLPAKKVAAGKLSV